MKQSKNDTGKKGKGTRESRNLEWAMNDNRVGVGCFDTAKRASRSKNKVDS